MALADLFKRKPAPLDGAGVEGVSPITSDLTANESVRKKQRLLLASVAGVGLVASSFWIFGDEGSETGPAGDEAAKVEVSTKDMVNKNC